MAERNLGIDWKKYFEEHHGTMADAAKLIKEGDCVWLSNAMATPYAFLEYLHEHMEDDVGLDELARHSGIDRFRLTRQFSKAFGLSPHAYLVRLRLRAARTLLAQGYDPTQVAIQVGFSDQSHLGRWFRRAYRLTPGAYQRHCTNVLD